MRHELRAGYTAKIGMQIAIQMPQLLLLLLLSSLDSLPAKAAIDTPWRSADFRPNGL